MTDTPATANPGDPVWRSRARELAVIAQSFARHPSPLLNRAGAFVRFAFRQVRKRFTDNPLVFEWEGLVLEAHQHGHAAAIAFYLRRQDWWELAFLQAFLRPGDHVADVGANIGIYSLFMAQRVGQDGHVVAIEPDPENHRRLASNVDRNRLPQIELLSCAVGDAVGTARFLVGLDCGGRLADDQTEGATVALTTLDELYRAREPPVFVKIDVEGSETAVLKGAQKLLDHDAAPVWQLELSNSGLGREVSDLARLLFAHGYHFFRYEPRTKFLVAWDHRQPAGNNLLAIRDPEQVVARLAGTA